MAQLIDQDEFWAHERTASTATSHQNTETTKTARRAVIKNYLQNCRIAATDVPVAGGQTQG